MKKVILIISTLLLSVSLTACSTSGDTSKEEKTKTNKSTKTVETKKKVDKKTTTKNEAKNEEANKTAATKDEAKKSKTSETATKNEVNKKVETADGFDIEVTGVKTSFGQSTDKKNMLEVSFEIKNTSDKDSLGRSAFDFLVEGDNGKTYEAYSMEARNFGDAIPAGKTLKGTGYYEIPASVKAVTVYYAPQGKKMAQWQLTVPEK
ncbi:DUF5067 domain-containing protein [Listeria kieliensis]|uniref:Uncharacterized protein n=1 Tax=Listeria kieliensis TaxID=1621700 RepID=A0A3D8TRK8_9LIST|nr:DUF5067 domain-containing protein [Listeria kieliensis]RDX01244.1 hypothetical protein UR08_09975 [Listeria kieliensis]